MLLLDANVPIYAEGREHIYRIPCRDILEQTKAWPDRYAIDVEAFQEILYVYSSRGELETGTGIVERLMARLPNIIPITTAEITLAMRLMLETRILSARDAIHAAVVINHNLEGIVSADQDFDRIPGLLRFDPMEVAAG